MFHVARINKMLHWSLLNMTINTVGTLNLSTLFGALFIFFCIYWDAWFFSLSVNTSSVLHSMLNAKHFEIVYVAGSMGFVPTGHRPIKSRHFYQAGDNTFDIYVFIRLRRQSFSDLVWGPWLQKTKCLLSGGPCNKTFTTLQCPSVPRIYLILILKKWKVCVD